MGLEIIERAVSPLPDGPFEKTQFGMIALTEADHFPPAAGRRDLLFHSDQIIDSNAVDHAGDSMLHERRSNRGVSYGALPLGAPIPVP